MVSWIKGTSVVCDDYEDGTELPVNERIAEHHLLFFSSKNFNIGVWVIKTADPASGYEHPEWHIHLPGRESTFHRCDLETAKQEALKVLKKYVESMREVLVQYDEFMKDAHSV